MLVHFDVFFHGRARDGLANHVQRQVLRFLEADAALASVDLAELCLRLFDEPAARAPREIVRPEADVAKLPDGMSERKPLFFDVSLSLVG